MRIDQDCDGVDQPGLCDLTCTFSDDGYCDDGGPNADYNLCGFGTDCLDCGARLDNDADGFYDDEGVTPLDSSLVLDCDDSDATINPDALDVGNDSIDQDCDGADGFGLCDDTCIWADDGMCDDGGPTASTAACSFGTDCSDCNPHYDTDGDSFYDDQGLTPYDASLALDCDDTDAAINPDAVDFAGDGIDQDCSGGDETGLCDDSCIYSDDGVCDDGGPNASYSVCDFGSDCTDCGARSDADSDGYYDDEGGVPLNSNLELDCDDSQASVYPGATEVPDDGIDQDCTGADLLTLCDNSCSYANDGDCDDGGPNSDYSFCALGTDCGDCGDRFDGDEDGVEMTEDCDDTDATNTDTPTSLDSADSSYASPTNVGSLVNGSDIINTTGYTNANGDDDGFEFYFEDHSDWFPPDDDEFVCTITAQSDVDLSVDLYRGRNL